MSTALINTLIENRLRVWHQAKELADRAADENRSFSAEEETRWDRLNGDLDEYDRRIKALQAQELRAQAADMRLSAGRAGATVRNDELRAWARGETGRSFDVRPSGPVDFRALSKLTGGAGGSVVPQGFYGSIVQHMIQNSAILQAGCTVLNTVSGEILPIPKTTAHSTATQVSEGATIATSDPAFGSVDLGAYKYGCKFQVSTELLKDSGVDLEGYLSAQAGRALGNAFGADCITGTGAGQPRGILTDAALGKQGTTGISGGFGTQATAGQGADYLVDVFHSVIAPYRQSPSCRWMMEDTTASTVRKLKTSQGEYVWEPSSIAGQPDMLLGKPVLIDPNIPVIALSAKSVLFGDWAQYFVRMAGGIRFERSDDFAFDADLVTFRALLRADAALVDLTGAIKYFQGGAS
jgi:HK97 family phage major capsid protein